ncbi:sigma-70 family RNA polymerase sigma factor [Stratiformator vulcanicus]|uniref:RNA polymerase sigma factor n=1 Tax=Stratiformator vulcanicus TaxID=2527980 RepID=A0A517R4A8_9PLAN|nr:sigma-70 family RNA polymerase sigma factor [Stratiformator vulcanicus]QDT38722.1 RNA polymerase sigma factor [Stratiformator vulcanicus]
MTSFFSSSDHDDSEFVVLITKSQRAIYGYILSLEPNRNAADDILQRTNVVLWQKQNQFERGSSFLAWACRTAYFEVLAFRKEVARRRVRVDATLLQQVADRSLGIAEELNDATERLTQCVERLASKDAELLRLRYTEGHSVKEISTIAGRTEKAIYRALASIHARLLRCIRVGVSDGGRNT